MSLVDTDGHRVPADEVTWISDNPDLFSVSGESLRVSMSEGTGHLTAQWNGYSDQSEVRVVPLEDQINLSNLSHFTSPGNWGTTKLYVFDTSRFYGQDYTVSWSVDRPDIVSIAEQEVDGYQAVRYTALQYGEALITCRVTLPDGTYAEAFCSVYVYYEP